MKLLTDKELRLREEIKEKQAEINRIRSMRKWTCKNCDRKEVIKNLYLVKDNYYVSPYSCDQGDCWRRSDELKVICPECGVISRYYGDTNDLYKLVKEYQNNFGGLIEEYSQTMGRISRYELVVKVSDDIGPGYKQWNSLLKQGESVTIHAKWFNA